MCTRATASHMPTCCLAVSCGAQVLTAHRTVISASALVVASLATFAIDRYQQHQRRQQQLREEQLQREREERERELRRQWLRILPALLLNMLAPFGSSSTTTSSRGHSSRQPLFPLLFGSSRDGDSGSSSRGGTTQSLLQLLPRLPGSSMDESSSGTSSSSSTTGSSSSSSGSTAPISAVLLAGLELGTWNFLATAAQACGLNLSTATKAAFLTQTTAVFTPCLAMLCGMAVLPVHWVACLAALLGSYCITLDSMGGLPETSSTAALVSSMERQQQELSATVQQQQPPGLVTEALEAPPVLAAADAGAGVSSAAGQQVELPLTVAAPAATAAADSRQYAPSTADAAALEEAFDSAFASSDALTEQQASGAEQQGDTAAAGQLPQLTPAQGQTQPLASSATGSQVSTSGVADAAAGGARAGAGNPQYSSSDSAGTAGSLQFAGQLADNQEAAAPASSIAAGGVPTEQFQQQRDLGQQDEQQVQELSPAQLMAGGDAQADTSSASASSSTGVATAKVGSSWGMTGEAYILLACCCYAIATVRLSMLAPGLDPVQLATSKTLTLAAASLVWLLAFGPGPEAAAEGGPAAAATSAAASTGAVAAAAGGVLEQAAAAVQSAWSSWQLPPAFETGNGKLLLFYSALGPGALATVLQTKGQGSVGAAQAQVFYSLTPIWAALLATLCLQGEEMGPLAWLGGCIIIAASIGAAISGSTGSGSSSGGSSDSTP